ncbi:MAG: tetratricopeptide repeat protein [Luteolibacter sp.]
MKRALAIFTLAAAQAAAQVPRAEPVADQTIQTDPGNDFFLRAKNLYDAAQSSGEQNTRVELYQRAALIFSDYITNYPNHPNAEAAWWYMGNSYYQGGSIDEGKRCFTTLINRYAQGRYAAAAAYTLAADYYNKGDYAFAAPMFERYAANATKPEERPRGYFFAGNSYRQLGRDREALVAFKKVLDDPAGGTFIPQTKLAMGHLTAKAGKLDEALNLFDSVVNSSATAQVRGEAALNASLAATKLGKSDLVDKYLRVIMNSPGMDEFQSDAQTALMNSQFSKKQYRQVIETYQKNTTRAEGEKAAIRLTLAARSYMQLKRPGEALPLFREVEKTVKPENDLAFDAAYYRLLCFYQLEGRHVPEQVDAFLQIYQKSRADHPRVHTALMAKAESLYAEKKISQAAKVYSQINPSLISEANRAGLFYQRGWVLAEAGDFSGAIRSLGEFISQYPKDDRLASALAKRAKCYADSSEGNKAVADFDKLISLKPDATLTSFAWLESARMRRADGNIPDMIVRYKGLLGEVKNLSPNNQAEANYWIGWGLVKTNAAKDAIGFLEKSRRLDPKAYAKHAGLLLALSYYASQDSPKLSEEIENAIKGNYISELPDQALQWAGMQNYSNGDYAASARYLGLIANPDEPRETPKEVWRYLAKARLESGDAEGGLTAASNVLAVEDNPSWKADGLVDQGRALLKLNRLDEARKAADAASDLRPSGRTSAQLRLLSGDLFFEGKDYKRAAADYLTIVSLHEDKDLKPLALHHLAEAYAKSGDNAEAEKYRTQLKTEFPAWKAK